MKKTEKKFSYTEIAVLSKLLSRKRIHTYHIRLATLLHCGWKAHEKHLVKEAVESLLKKDFLRWVKKDKKALSINKEKVTEIAKLCAKEC